MDQEDLEDWADRHGSLWFRLRDGEGRSYGLLTGGRKYSDDASWPYQETVQQVYERLEDLPRVLTLVPYLSDTGEEFAPISLSLNNTEFAGYCQRRSFPSGQAHREGAPLRFPQGGPLPGRSGLLKQIIAVEKELLNIRPVGPHNPGLQHRQSPRRSVRE